MSRSETVADQAGVDIVEPDADRATGYRGGDEGPTASQRSRRRGRLWVKRATVRTHRWLSFSLGLLLLLVTTTGAAVVYAPEWTRWTNPVAFQVTGSDDPVTVVQAMAIVGRAHPDFQPGSVNVYAGLYEVYSGDRDAYPGFYGVDPGSGRITGYVNPDRGFMALMDQIHECFFTCDNYPAYLHVLNDPVPRLGMHWLKDVTWGSLLLGVAGLLLLFLAVSGIWLWWPGRKRLRHGFRVRMGKGRYARDYDLHQVIGMAAVPFLLVWGITGTSFEFHWVNTAWYALTGGEQVKEVTFSSNPIQGQQPSDIGLDAAIAAGRSQAGPDAKLSYVSLPAAGDPAGYYDLWFSVDFDQYRHGASPGQFEVEVDRHDADHLLINNYGTAATLSNKIFDDLGPATFHFGQSVNGWWRLFWFAFGLTPLALAITGISTWLAKRAVRERRRRARAVAAATGGPSR